MCFLLRKRLAFNTFRLTVCVYIPIDHEWNTPEIWGSNLYFLRLNILKAILTYCQYSCSFAQALSTQFGPYLAKCVKVPTVQKSNHRCKGQRNPVFGFDWWKKALLIYENKKLREDRGLCSPYTAICRCEEHVCYATNTFGENRNDRHAETLFPWQYKKL